MTKKKTTLSQTQREAAWKDSSKWKLLLPICGMLAVCIGALVLGVLSMLHYTLPDMTFARQQNAWEICELTYNQEEQSFTMENRQKVELSPDTGAPLGSSVSYVQYKQLGDCDPDLFVQKVQEGQSSSLTYCGLVYYSGCFYLAGEGEDGWYLTYWDGAFPASSQQPVPLKEFCSQAFWYHLYEKSGGNGLYDVL